MVAKKFNMPYIVRILILSYTFLLYSFTRRKELGTICGWLREAKDHRRVGEQDGFEWVKLNESW